MGNGEQGLEFRVLGLGHKGRTGRAKGVLNPGPHSLFPIPYEE
jgi:hypothetical protein